MMKKLPLFKIVPIESELTQIAIVDTPAIEEFFLFFNEELPIRFSEDQMIIKGPVMIPDRPIYRNDSLGERFVVYDTEAIRTAAQLFFKNGLGFNEGHKESVNIKILESWFLDEINDWGLPSGTWMVTAKVEDLDVWNEIKTNKWRGFSFQALFQNELIGTKTLKFNKTNMKDLKDKIFKAIEKILFAEEPIEEPTVEKTDDAVPALTTDEIKQLIQDSITEALSMIMETLNRMDARIAKLEGDLGAAQEQIEEFGKQPLAEPRKTEEVLGEHKSDNPALKYFNN